MTEWERKINGKKVTVGVLGLGYVGLPLVREFASSGLKVIGFDIDEKKVKTLNSGRSIIKHIPHSQVKQMVKAELFSATANMARLKAVDTILVCVPTPLTQNREPDMQFIISSSKTIAKYLRAGQLVGRICSLSLAAARRLPNIYGLDNLLSLKALLIPALLVNWLRRCLRAAG
jgi:UDP-N-acetyl-D-mannosaminuronate dehydrogenase